MDGEKHKITIDDSGQVILSSTPSLLLGKLNTAETRISSLEPNSKLLKPIAGIKGAVDPRLIKWLTDKKVDQVTTGKL
ncbi:MAG: hypothetical protein F6K47_40870 [Symploca sp. SIO2E6]|nr:hypothetical protein [Symploca sp. SIO2E6]